jgi:hypothetical protein
VFSPVSAHAQFTPVALGGRVLIGSLIDQFEGTASWILLKAEGTGNAIVGRAGAELRLSIQNLGVLLDDQRTKLLSEFGPELRQVFIEMNRLISSVDELSNQAGNIAELAALDLDAMLNRIKFLTDKKYFYINSIKGYTLLSSSTRHVLVVRGIGIGLKDPQHHCDTRFVIGTGGNRVEVPSLNFINGPDQFTVSITIPDDLVRSHFKEEDLSILPAEIRCTMTTRRLFGTHTDNYIVPMSLLLLPNVAGHLTIQEYRKTPLALTGEVKSKAFGKAYGRTDCSHDHPCIYQELNACVVANQQIVAVQYECNGACGWSTSVRRRELLQAEAVSKEACVAEIAADLHKPAEEVRRIIASPVVFGYNPVKSRYDNCWIERSKNHVYVPDYDIQSDKKCASLYRSYDAEAQTTFTYHVMYQELARGTERNEIKNIDLRYGVPIIQKLDKDNADCTFSASGLITATNQRIDGTQTSLGLSTAYPLRLLSGDRVGGVCTLTFELKP